MRLSFVGVLAGMALLAAPKAHAVVITGFDEVADGTSDVMFRSPSISGSTSGNVAADDMTAVSTEQAFSGDKSLKVDFSFVDSSPTRWVRLTTSGGKNYPNPTIDIQQPLAFKIYVASEDPIGFALGLRETNPTVDIGANGGGSGPIEFIGSTTATPPTPTANHVITPGSWQDLVFDIPNEPVASFTGNGVLESTTGKAVLEHLAIRSPGTGRPITFYIDDVRVGLPNGGAIPEPGSMALLASGFLPLLTLRRRTR
jgi:hypothetical protein